jgi:hypothetical protein
LHYLCSEFYQLRIWVVNWLFIKTFFFSSSFKSSNHLLITKLLLSHSLINCVLGHFISNYEFLGLFSSAEILCCILLYSNICIEKIGNKNAALHFLSVKIFFLLLNEILQTVNTVLFHILSKFLTLPCFWETILLEILDFFS